MYQKILTIQDISCVGQCSLTVALPILSACGLETCILPSAVLSTHTAGFKGFTFRDLTEDMPAILNHWVSEKIQFNAIYTGYLGSVQQIEYVKDIFSKVAAPNCITVVDPAMADNGVLYSIFNDEYVERMKTLAFKADFIVPNITEACFLTGIEYRETYDEAYIASIMDALTAAGCKNIILTGVSYREGKTGIAVQEGSNRYYYEHEKLPQGCHGTGDVYASAFVGALVNGKPALEAAKIAADFTLACIKNTAGDKSHWYGVKFEPVLGELIQMLH